MVVLVILALGLAVAAGAAAWSIARDELDEFDVTERDRWLVRQLRDHPRLAAFLRRRLSSETAGGLLLTASFALIFLAMLVAGSVFEMVDNGTGFARWDESVARWGASNATETSTRVLRLVTTLGGSLWVTMVALVVGAWAWWKFRSVHGPAFIAVVVAGQAILNNALKWVVGRERPDFAQLGGFGGTAFPSGHSAAAAATWAAVAYLLGRGKSRFTQALLTVMAVLIAGAVAATRVLLGVHWLTDVIAGLAVGFGWFLAVAVAYGGKVFRLGGGLQDAAEKANASPALEMKQEAA